MKYWVQWIDNVSKKGDRVSLEDRQGNPISVTIPEIQEVLNKEIAIKESMKNQLIHYAELTEKAINSYIATFHERLPSPEFTVQDCNELMEFTKECDVISGEEHKRWGLENIKKIREKLGMPESSRLNELLLANKEVVKRVNEGVRMQNEQYRISVLKERWQYIIQSGSVDRRNFDRGIEFDVRKVGAVVNNDLPDVLPDDVGERATLRGSLLSRMKEDLDSHLSAQKCFGTSAVKVPLNAILEFEKDVAEINPPKWDLSDFPDCSQKKAEYETQIADMEKLSSDYCQYHELVCRTMDQYICHGTKLSPETSTPLTKADFAELKRLHKEFKGSDNNLKKIEKMERVVFEQAKSAEIGQVVITEDFLETGNTLPGNKRGLQERFGEIQRSRRNLIMEKKAAKAREILADKGNKVPDRGGR